MILEIKGSWERCFEAPLAYAESDRLQDLTKSSPSDFLVQTGLRPTSRYGRRAADDSITCRHANGWFGEPTKVYAYK